jgi:hypothetical protein
MTNQSRTTGSPLTFRVTSLPVASSSITVCIEMKLSPIPAIEESGCVSQLHALHRSWAGVVFRNLYEQELFARGRVFPGVAEALQVPENAELPLCCITNKESRFALPLLEAAGLRKRFPVSVRRPSGRSEAESEHAARHVQSVGRAAPESAARRRLSRGYFRGAQGELPCRGGHLRVWRLRRACGCPPRRHPRRSG